MLRNVGPPLLASVLSVAAAACTATTARDRADTVESAASSDGGADSAPRTATCTTFSDHFFSATHIQPGLIQIWLDGALHPLETLSATDLLRARDVLEAELELPTVTPPVGEVEIRKMLRGLRYAIGPNCEPSAAKVWRVSVVVAERIDVAWAVGGAPRAFHAHVSDATQWRVWASREMGYLTDLIYKHSWGRVRIEWEVRSSAVPIAGVSPDGQYLRPQDIAPIVLDAYPALTGPGVIVLVPAEGTGDPPSFFAPAYTATAVAGQGYPPGTSATIAHSTEARMMRDHGWACLTSSGPSGCGGLVHEFWHQVEGVLKQHIHFTGFVPSNHNPADATLLVNELLAQRLPAPTEQYGELYGTFPTWRMAAKIETFP